MSRTNKTVQDKISELHELVAWFDSDDFVLESALDTFKKAEQLATEIEADLTKVKNDVQIIKESFDTGTS